MTPSTRRRFLTGLGTALGAIGLSAVAQKWRLLEQLLTTNPNAGGLRAPQPGDSNMANSIIEQKFPLDFQWQTQEPFLFCVHHLDLYPAGTKDFSVKPEQRVGRNIGSDFHPKDGFRMYHGDTVPGFPVHPHRGFETVTIVRRGYVDHADSMGAAGRYGGGDVQWMTAGKGVQHSEMFPLLRPDADNTMELFQIWLNLPRKNKMVAPDFKMFWHEQIPVVDLRDKKARVTVIAGDPGNVAPLAPPPDSWAADAGSETWIWLMKVDQGGEVEIPASKGKVNRSLYFYEGKAMELNGERIGAKTGLFVESQTAARLRAVDGPIEVLLLQSKPIGEPVVQYGPFVMNSEAEIRQTIGEYRATQFGGWPWDRDDMVHGEKIERFAKYPDGRVVKPEGA